MVVALVFRPVQVEAVLLQVLVVVDELQAKEAEDVVLKQMKFQ